MVSRVRNMGKGVEDHRGGEGKPDGRTSERETNREGLWSLGNKLNIREGRGVRGWGDRGMGIKEGTCWEEPWALY